MFWAQIDFEFAFAEPPRAVHPSENERFNACPVS
jgi:hypothetical protein